jgi:hypothetical protein
MSRFPFVNQFSKIYIEVRWAINIPPIAYQY